ncbi:MAG: glycosyltransferase family 4 protein, partial [Patescibacteria group bacterium]
MKKVAIVYDRVNKFGGAERVLLTLHEMFPDAPLYTSVYNKENAKWAEVFPKIYTSFLQKIPLAKKYNELFGWLMPIAFESFDFKNYELVISVTSEAAKGIISDFPATRLSYC